MDIFMVLLMFHTQFIDKLSGSVYVHVVCCIIYKSSDVPDKGKASEEDTSSRETSVEPAAEAVEVSH